MDPDDQVCLCFRVSLRKIANYCKRERPRRASQIADCLSAGTGCGWCVPYLERIHAQAARGDEPDLPISPEQYAAKRSSYRTTGEREGDADGD